MAQLRRTMKEVRAFLLSPMPAAMLGGLVSWATGAHPRPVSIAIFYLLLLYPVQLALGLPIRAFLLKTHRRSALGFAAGGTVMIAIPSAAYLLWAVTTHPEKSAAASTVFLLWSFIGGLTGLCYWCLIRPDANARALQAGDA